MQGQSELIFRDGAPTEGPGSVLSCSTSRRTRRISTRCSLAPGRAVVGDGHLRAGHPDRRDPVVILPKSIQHTPQRGDAFGTDGKPDPRYVRRDGHINGEITGIDPSPLGVRATTQAARPGHDAAAPAPSDADHQYPTRGRRSTLCRLRQAGHVRAPHPLTLVVVGHALFEPPVDDVGGVEVDRGTLQQHDPSGLGQQGQGSLA
jgi:hypothetical protein